MDGQKNSREAFPSDPCTDVYSRADPKNENIGYILGKPVIIDDNIADDNIFLGNFNYLGYNIPEGIVVETSRESSFKYGVIDYRALAIADTKPLVTEAFIKLSKAE